MSLGWFMFNNVNMGNWKPLIFLHLVMFWLTKIIYGIKWFCMTNMGWLLFFHHSMEEIYCLCLLHQKQLKHYLSWMKPWLTIPTHTACYWRCQTVPVWYQGSIWCRDQASLRPGRTEWFSLALYCIKLYCPVSDNTMARSDPMLVWGCIEPYWVCYTEPVR